MAVAFSWSSAFRLALFLLLLAGIAVAFTTIPVEKTLEDFLLWVKLDLGPWGPLALAIAYIPLTILAVPASVLSLGGGYLFGLPVGFIADSVGATIGAMASLFLGKTIARSYVNSKLLNCPKFQAVAIAIERSGFKIVLLLRLAPLVPFNMLNYLLAVTPVNLGEYIAATWLGMMPITFALVYAGTTLKDLSDVRNGWAGVSATHWVLVALGFLLSVILMVYTTKIAKDALDNALAENVNAESKYPFPWLPTVAESGLDIEKPLLSKRDPSRNHV